MNEKDLEDVVLLVRGVLEHHLSDALATDLANEIEDSLRENWHILQLMRERKTETRGDGKILRCKDCGEFRLDGYCNRHHMTVPKNFFCGRV